MRDEAEVSFLLAAAVCTYAASCGGDLAYARGTGSPCVMCTHSIKLLLKALEAHRLLFGRAAKWAMLRYKFEIEAYEVPDEVKAGLIDAANRM